MARNLFSVTLQAIRAAERADRARAATQVRRTKDAARESAAREMLDKKSYQEARAKEVELLNEQLDERNRTLEALLTDSLDRKIGLNWDAVTLKVYDRDLEKFPELALIPEPKMEDFTPPIPKSFSRLVPGWKARYDKTVAEAVASYSAASQQHLDLLDARKQRLNELNAEAKLHNTEIVSFRGAYRSGVAEAVAGYFELIFEQLSYPETFPVKWKVAFLSDSKQLVVDFNLPSMDEAIPHVEKHRYTKSTDQITDTKRSQKARQSFYSSVVAQCVLRRLHEVFASDTEQIVEVATVNAFVDAIDPSTGRPVKPCLVSVRTTRSDFESLDLRQVDPTACLRRLHASVSRSPSELAAVKPIVEMNMVDPRFIQETDILSTLDLRPNLMDLTPGEFENLITNLFQSMGLETKLTQASRDGGVDCVAFDARPVLGGKVIIQAKRYKNTVGVSAVRDLYGTVHNEGASKGILVTTSGYGKAAYEFANGKPLELLEGSHLLYLLKEHGGVDAKIVVPDDWREPSVSD